MLIRLFVIILIPLLSFALSLSDARHLMDRTSFGLNRQEFQILKNKNKKEAVTWLLNANQNIQTAPLPSLANTPIVRKKRMKRISIEERKAFRREFRKRVIGLKSCWMRTMIETPTPLREKMMLFWHNHFTSSIKKVRSPYLMLKQNELL